MDVASTGTVTPLTVPRAMAGPVPEARAGVIRESMPVRRMPMAIAPTAARPIDFLVGL
jgi:hypothetical protein